MQITELVNYTELRDLLDQGMVRFKYIKKDWSTRIALGTRNTDLIPREYQIKHVEDISEKTVTYFDLESKGYRSVKVDTLIAVK